MGNQLRLLTIPLGVLLAAVVNLETTARSDQFEERKRERVEACRAIPEDDYSTALIFNPPGQSTMFHRAACLQQVAHDERDADLCGEVKERKSWFFDGSGISDQSCRELVAERIEQDRQEAASKDIRSIHRVDSVEFYKNGNERDFDAVVTTKGSFPGAYLLNISVTSAQSRKSISIHKRSYSYGSPNVPRYIWLERGQLEEALGAGFQHRELLISVTLQLEKTDYNRFYYDLIPAVDRSSDIKEKVRFDRLPLNAHGDIN
jgi:hypothetical protein